MATLSPATRTNTLERSLQLHVPIRACLLIGSADGLPGFSFRGDCLYLFYFPPFLLNIILFVCWVGALVLLLFWFSLYPVLRSASNRCFLFYSPFQANKSLLFLFFIYFLVFFNPLYIHFCLRGTGRREESMYVAYCVRVGILAQIGPVFPYHRSQERESDGTIAGRRRGERRLYIE